MTSSKRQTVWALLAVIGTLAALSGWLWWLITRDPDIPFLTQSPPAEWIVYPAGSTSVVHPAVEVAAVFHGSFVLDRRPGSAVLRVRCHRTGQVTINEIPLTVLSGPEADWKRPRDADVSSLLHEGENQIHVVVKSRFGPPALWLSVEGDGIAWSTDGSWQVDRPGATSRRARLATTPMDRWSRDSPGASGDGSTVLGSARRSLPLWVAFAGVTAVLLLAVRAKAAPGHDHSPRGASWLLALAALGWGALVWNNAQKPSDQLFGFDVEGHLRYVAYILRYARLPLADEGWEMYQPPLYYLLAAGVLRSFGHTRLDYDTLALLRWVNAAGGVLLLASLVTALRSMFPDHPSRWVTGFSLGAFLPAELYMLRYINNEIWAAAWAAAAFAVCLWILRRERTSLGPHLALGALLGAAMLTKFSALIPVGVIVVVLVGRLIVRGERSARAYGRSVGAVLVACGLVCGWHFLRVAWRFGNPFIGNWDSATGFAWWQDPGYHTSGYYTTFGRSLVDPIFSSFHSFADCVFSTLWGDGLYGGSTDTGGRLPWNHDLMIGGYLLACLPTVAILVGLAHAMVELVREPRAEWFLVLGVVGAMALAMLVMTLRLPFHSQAKASYGLIALVPLGILGASGFDVLVRGARGVRGVLSLLFGTWVLNAFAAFWIRG